LRPGTPLRGGRGGAIAPPALRQGGRGGAILHSKKTKKAPFTVKKCPSCDRRPPCPHISAAALLATELAEMVERGLQSAVTSCD